MFGKTSDRRNPRPERQRADSSFPSWEQCEVRGGQKQICIAVEGKSEPKRISTNGHIFKPFSDFARKSQCLQCCASAYASLLRRCSGTRLAQILVSRNRHCWSLRSAVRAKNRRNGPTH